MANIGRSRNGKNDSRERRSRSTATAGVEKTASRERIAGGAIPWTEERCRSTDSREKLKGIEISKLVDMRHMRRDIHHEEQTADLAAYRPAPVSENGQLARAGDRASVNVRLQIGVQDASHWPPCGWRSQGQLEQATGKAGPVCESRAKYGKADQLVAVSSTGGFLAGRWDRNSRGAGCTAPSGRGF